MVSRFKIVDEKYIEESKNKSENEDTKNSSEWLKNVFKTGRMKEISKQILKSTTMMSLTNDCRNSLTLPSMLSTSNRSGSSWSYGLSRVFSEVAEFDRGPASWAISATSENTRD